MHNIFDRHADASGTSRPTSRAGRVIRGPLAALLLVGCLMAGCGDDAAPAPEVHDHPATPPTAATDASDATNVLGVRAARELPAGSAVTVTGRVGGRMEPVSAEAGMFVIMDTAVPSCADLHGDQCPTPWDYCCEPPESMRSAMATVDASAAGIDFASLSPLATVVIRGTVDESATAEAFVVRADAIEVR